MKNKNTESQVLSSKENSSFIIDPKLSRLEWTGKKIGGEHSGTIALSEGKFQMENGNLTGDFSIDMNSINTTDLSGEWKEKLDGHLKSEDFFGTEKFPVAKFSLTQSIPVENEKESFLVKGNLTIKDKTNEEGFVIKLKTENEKISGEGIITIDRSKYNVRYGSKSFFANIGDKMIHDTFTVKFHIIAVR